MGRDLTPECRAPSQTSEEDDKHGIEADSDRAHEVYSGASHPLHIEAGDAASQHGQQKQASIPAMNCHGASPYLRNELNRSAKCYDRGQQSMRGEGQISSGIAGDVPLEEKCVLGPGL